MLYSFELLKYFKDTQQEFLMKLDSTVKFIKKLPDGSHLAIVSKNLKILNRFLENAYLKSRKK